MSFDGTNVLYTECATNKTACTTDIRPYTGNGFAGTTVNVNDGASFVNGDAAQVFYGTNAGLFKITCSASVAPSPGVRPAPFGHWRSGSRPLVPRPLRLRRHHLESRKVLRAGTTCGPHLIDTVEVLDDIVRHMEGHQTKRHSMLRPLALATRFDARA